MKITKAVIPAAGLGTRFLPATKAQPKEMLPIVDKPAIQYVVEEAVAAGIKDILIITGRSKRAIEDHFDKAIELEIFLKTHGKDALAKEIGHIHDLANFYFIRQTEPLGLGHAILSARSYIDDEPFAVLLGDDIIVSERPCIGELMSIYERKKSTILAVEEIEGPRISSYGVIKPGEAVEENLWKVKGVVEKPARPPSRLAVIGRYVMTPEIFSLLAKVRPDKRGEIQLAPALEKLITAADVFAYKFPGKRYDIGDKLGYLKAVVDFALARKDIGPEFAQYLKEL